MSCCQNHLEFNTCLSILGVSLGDSEVKALGTDREQLTLVPMGRGMRGRCTPHFPFVCVTVVPTLATIIIADTTGIISLVVRLRLLMVR